MYRETSFSTLDQSRGVCVVCVRIYTPSVCNYVNFTYATRQLSLLSQNYLRSNDNCLWYCFKEELKVSCVALSLLRISYVRLAIYIFLRVEV